jgi:hypothetical protein
MFFFEFSAGDLINLEMMPKKMTRFTLFLGLLFVLITLVGVVGLKVAEGWIFGVSPREQYLMFIHSDTPPLRIPVQLALQLPFMKVSESMGNHDSKIVDAGSVD